MLATVYLLEKSLDSLELISTKGKQIIAGYDQKMGSFIKTFFLSI